MFWFDARLFQILCILDSALAVENREKGEIKLYYEKDGKAGEFFVGFMISSLESGS